MKETIDKVATFLLGVDLMIFISVAVLFNYFPENKVINFICSSLIVFAAINITWIRFYREIRPVWLGITFGIFLLCVYIIIALIIKHFNMFDNDLIGIPIVYGLAAIISKFESQLCNFILKLIHKK